MIEETLSAEKPSKNDSFRGKVRELSTFTYHSTYWRDDETRPDTAMLVHEWDDIAARATLPDSMDYETAQRGATIIGWQLYDWTTAADFLERYLSQPDLTASQTAWARYQQLIFLNMGYGRLANVLRHRAFLNWMQQQIAQESFQDDALVLSRGGGLVAPEAPDRLPKECLMLWAVNLMGVVTSWKNTGHVTEWLSLAEAALTATPRTATTREFRQNLLVTMSFVSRSDDGIRIIERLMPLAEEAEAEENDWKTPRWRFAASYRRAEVLLQYSHYAAAKAGDNAPTMPLAEIEEVIQLKDAWEPLLEGAEWDKRYELASARVNCAYLLRNSGRHERAIPLFQQVFDAGFGCYISYFECAASLWYARHDRAETLALLRRAAAERGASNPLKDFKNQQQFADVHDDPEFLAALSGGVRHNAETATPTA